MLTPSDKWAAVFFCLSALVVVVLLSNYGVNWMHPEIYIHLFQRPSLYAEFHWHDLARAFDCQMMDQCGRTRYLSYLVFYLNSVFRNWLVQYMPPHPSLSLTWVLSLASIFCLARTTFDLTNDRAAAWLVAGLYALSGGLLSMMLMLFNPAKPLAAFFVTLSLMLAARIWRSGDLRAHSAKALALYAALFLAYCSDETAWVVYFVIPILLPRIFSRARPGLAICLLASFPLFLAFATWGAPAATSYLWGYQDINFWDFALNIGSRVLPDEGSLFDRVKVTSFFLTGYNLLRDEFALPGVGPVAAALSLLPLLFGVAAAGLLADPRRRALLARAVIAWVVFVLAQAMIMFHGGPEIGLTVKSVYYYGALFSNFSLLVVGIAISAFRASPASRAACILASVYFGCVSLVACLSANKDWMTRHEIIYARAALKPSGCCGYYGPLKFGAPLSEAKVRRYWEATRAGENTRALRASFAPKDAWLFEGMDAWTRSARACRLAPACSGP